MNKAKEKIIIHQLSHCLTVSHEIKRLFKLNMSELIVLANCYDVQKPKQPYFIVPDVRKRLPTIRKDVVYNYIRSLCTKGFIELDFKTKLQMTPNYYIITGNGKRVLTKYAKELNVLIS